uniref:Uncharacterized protein n=1 Tax=Bionectria ochroleuca TaxID=29856 RepID=A0A8H7TPT0_BIOOC
MIPIEFYVLGHPLHGTKSTHSPAAHPPTHIIVYLPTNTALHSSFLNASCPAGQRKPAFYATPGFSPSPLHLLLFIVFLQFSYLVIEPIAHLGTQPISLKPFAGALIPEEKPNQLDSTQSGPDPLASQYSASFVRLFLTFSHTHIDRNDTNRLFPSTRASLSPVPNLRPNSHRANRRPTSPLQVTGCTIACVFTIPPPRDVTQARSIWTFWPQIDPPATTSTPLPLVGKIPFSS